MVPVDTPVCPATWWGGELVVVEQAGVGNLMVFPQVGGDAVEELLGVGVVRGVVERGGQGIVVDDGVDAAGELDDGPSRLCPKKARATEITYGEG